LKADNVNADERKKRIISKEKMKEIIGHSPDYLDMLLMRMFFLVKPKRFVGVIKGSG
jgi:phage terminase large subunit